MNAFAIGWGRTVCFRFFIQSNLTFQYSDLKAGSPTIKKNAAVPVGVDVKNTGNRRGAEVAPLYIEMIILLYQEP